jgi:hypothetical protein
VFGTDSFVDWFTPPPAPSAQASTIYNQVASWPGWEMGTMTDPNFLTDPTFVDTSFPKGKAFGDWLLSNGVGVPVGNSVQLSLVDVEPSVLASGPPTYPGSTRWLYQAKSAGDASYSTSYLSFNTPVGTPSDQQCGRAVFSGVHVYYPQGTAVFPAECGSLGGPGSPYGVNQKALEFLFFDQSSCVQNDQEPPKPPTPLR